jgi:hypothetical protein
MFGASFAWAVESSPIVYESPEPTTVSKSKTSSKSPAFEVTAENLWLVKVNNSTFNGDVSLST